MYNQQLQRYAIKTKILNFLIHNQAKNNVKFCIPAENYAYNDAIHNNLKLWAP